MQSYLESGLANKYSITTTNITAPDATYQWMILTDGSGVTRRMNFATYLSANYATTSSLTALATDLDNCSVKKTITSSGTITANDKEGSGVYGFHGRTVGFDIGANNLTIEVNTNSKST